MNELVGALLPLGVAAALSPMPLIALIIALFSKQRAANGLGFLLGSLVFPKRTEAPLTRLRETLIAHNSVILTMVFVLAGTTMVGHAIAGL